jgi:hypothetical protein
MLMLSMLSLIVQGLTLHRWIDDGQKGLFLCATALFCLFRFWHSALLGWKHGTKLAGAYLIPKLTDSADVTHQLTTWMWRQPVAVVAAAASGRLNSALQGFLHVSHAWTAFNAPRCCLDPLF